MEFKKPLLQEFFVNGRLMVYVELELRDDGHCRKFLGRPVVGSSLDFGVQHRIGQNAQVFCRNCVCAFGFFFGYVLGWRSHTLLDGDCGHHVAYFVVVGHIPEGRPQV